MVEVSGATERPRVTTLPFLLAGPVLRRAETTRVCVWLATSEPAEVRLEVCSLTSGATRPLGSGAARQVRVGEHLFIHLATAAPRDGAELPTAELLGYDLEVTGADGHARRLADLGRLGPGGIAYGELPLPSFVLADAVAPLRALHGSCRQLHGTGEDALCSVDEVLAARATDVSERPTALFLTGDQIYGDEVAGPLVGHLGALGRALLGDDDDRSVPGTPPLSTIPPYRRQAVAERACFTSTKADNHLFSLGEYLAAYLVAWDEATWPARLPAFDDAVPAGAAHGRERLRLRRRYAAELANLETARRALPAVRRALANVPVYTCFDDHDVTDDWNLTWLWQERVRASPTGRRVVANALAAFWAFQGWGNDPELYDDAFVEAVTGDDPSRFEHALWTFDRWSYVAPTSPPTVVLDTRTQRGFDSDEGAARLIDTAALRRVRDLALAARVPEAGTAILVSPVPVFGLEIQERRQKFLAGKLGPYEIDFEAWHSALRGLVDLMRLLIEDLGLERCVVLSGDVHYGLTVEATFTIGDRRLHVAQLVSSAIKHSGKLARTGLGVLGRLVRPEHQRVGWDDAPELARSAGLVHRLLERPVNNDEWTDGGPVFLPPCVAAQAAPDQPPPYAEARRYVHPRERPSSVVVGESNVGLVTIDGDRVVHQVIGRTSSGTATYTTEVELGRRDAPLSPSG